METSPRLHYLDSTLCKWSASYCPILHPFIHPNTCGTNPPPRSKDNMRPRRSGPAQVQVTEILFPHLSFLPMNEALSAEEWDPYLPFGIAHVVTNQKQMSRQVVLCSDSVCVRDWVGGGLDVRCYGTSRVNNMVCVEISTCWCKTCTLVCIRFYGHCQHILHKFRHKWLRHVFIINIQNDKSLEQNCRMWDVQRFKDVSAVVYCEVSLSKREETVCMNNVTMTPVQLTLYIKVFVINLSQCIRRLV